MEIIINLITWYEDPKTKTKKINFNKETKSLNSIVCDNCNIREKVLERASKHLKIHPDWIYLSEDGFIQDENHLHLIYSIKLPEEIGGLDWCDFNEICEMRPLPNKIFEIITRAINNSESYFEEFYNGRAEYKSESRKRNRKDG